MSESEMGCTWGTVDGGNAPVQLIYCKWKSHRKWEDLLIQCYQVLQLPPQKRWIHAGEVFSEVKLTLTWWFKRWPCEETVKTPLLKLTCLHLKMDGWNTRFLLGPGLFSGVMLLSVSVDSIDMCLKQTPYAAERIYAGFTPLIPWLVFPLLLVTAPWESRWFVGVRSSTGKDLQFIPYLPRFYRFAKGRTEGLEGLSSW